MSEANPTFGNLSLRHVDATERQAQRNDEVAEKILQFGEKHPKISKHVKSLRHFKQGIGGKPTRKRVPITEFARLTEMDKFFHKLKENKDCAHDDCPIWSS